ncbi:MAG: DUF3187 family protein [SAR324 cluster bacterium]|nr:DUF3187 family protein [SAR324 cluster bacterium]
MLGLFLAVPAYGQRGGGNGGLGPVAIRSFFPPTLPYLDFSPDQALTIPKGDLRITYQFAVTSTFINTQDNERPDVANPPCSCVITPADVDAGLTEVNFLGNGYGAYIDVEMERHMFEIRYGWKERLELSIELAWISLGGGGLDDAILEVEEQFNAVNTNREAADRDRFDYYLILDGKFIHNTSQPFTAEPQDPVLNVKWNLSTGSFFLPSLSIKLSYKAPLTSNLNPQRRLVSSGKSDTGYSFLLGKRFGPLIAHYQLGKIRLQIPGKEFETERKFRMFALEAQVNQNNAFIAQVVSQSKFFSRQDSPSTIDLDLARDTELLTLGFKHGRRGFRLTLGFTEDINSTVNEADVTLTLELGWQF